VDDWEESDRPFDAFPLYPCTKGLVLNRHSYLRILAVASRSTVERRTCKNEEKANAVVAALARSRPAFQPSQHLIRAVQPRTHSSCDSRPLLPLPFPFSLRPPRCSCIKSLKQLSQALSKISARLAITSASVHALLRRRRPPQLPFETFIKGSPSLSLRRREQADQTPCSPNNH
jgi:hypothetical protein